MTQATTNKKLTENTLDNLLEGFQLIDHDWRYIYVNETVVKQSKYASKDDLLGYTMMEKYPGIESTPLFKVMEHCMNEGINTFLENEFNFPDGSRGWFELRIEPVREGIFILSMDITERKRAEKSKEKYIHGLEEMIFITSHKIRQPVTNIIGLASILNRKNLPKEKVEQITDYIKESIASLDLFTKELTDFIDNLKKDNKN